ncbi:GntR family transcriptional regulator [Loktanella sp. SALINAS62]|uniref:GntR family transcriptional regulator n=1 Tax=Loktanella sp. SALINAS62 TaxID=2706124 RepID=UPI001B8D1570|nr:GntR family transcriptional regulator [Loktanella sp. SALINAS62]MBS1301401.1 GntR family transcriptional regulator [Loktanella sp. SALINAS62]
MSTHPDRVSPLYLQIAHKLEQRIRDDIYPVGTLLPTEAELVTAFQVSRHTIRQAIEQLKRNGTLSARKGIGTKVESRGTDWRTQFRGQSRHDLFDFSRDSELHFQTKSEVTARSEIAAEMGIQPGRKFTYAAGLRYFKGEDIPFCWNEVYLDESVAEVLQGVDVLRKALFHMVESYTGERIASIHQELTPVHIDEHIAQKLDLPAGTLALRMTRRYLSSRGRLLEYAIQTLPGDRFRYRTILSAGEPKT